MESVINILVVDDHPLFRHGVISSLNSAADLTVIGEAEDAMSAVRLARELQPDIVLLDVSMPGANGLWAVPRLLDAHSDCKIIMLTVSEDEDVLLEALKSGARGYLLKGASAYELQRVVRTVYEGEVYITASMATTVLMEMARPRAVSTPGPTNTSSLNELTSREREILELVAQGLTNREVGQRLYLTEKTVKHYMTNIMQKLQVRSRVEAALLAHREGLGVGEV